MDFGENLSLVPSCVYYPYLLVPVIYSNLKTVGNRAVVVFNVQKVEIAHRSEVAFDF
jgi:hypothetical protein